ncbi:MAG TPA: hypothetical protein VGO06_24980 [Bosea sp. (in: a-proteobacteria)]|jgi:hypothetical protein|uniref:hypothetical protein n=1 Tax=Bosea sp. (in: a-proteobacteria) TaxID=1871050 RepID=UPI002E10F311|nr:hypothetical protein [Bosea sp. (in: a-proteobacteria)]
MQILLALIFGCLVASSSGARAQALGQEALAGYSIASHYEEVLEFPNGNFVRQIWRDRLYFSTKGRIFHKFALESGHPASDRAFEAISGEGGGGGFRWVGNGVSRPWRSPRGGTGTQSFHISAQAGGYSCRMSLERLGMRLTARPVSQSCRVTKGNILASD